jgi:hypothetical protein
MKKENLIIAFCLMTINIFSANIYVATTGSNSGTGTLADPFKTITKAASVASAGDFVWVRGGIYRNIDFNDGDIWEGENAVYISAHGSSGNYITFMPYQNEKVLIEFNGTHGVLIQNASYIRFKGFEIKGVADQITQANAKAAWGLYKEDGVIKDLICELRDALNQPIPCIDPTSTALIGLELLKDSKPNIQKPNYYNGRGIIANKSHHIDIENNIVRDVPSAGIRGESSDYINIIGNEVFRCTYWTTQGVGAITISDAEVRPTGDINTGEKIIIKNNKVYQNENRFISWNPTKTFVTCVIDEGTGIFLTRNQAYTNGIMVIANNLSYKNGASGIVCHFTNRVMIEHNTVYDNGTTNNGSPGGIGVNTASDVTIKNNIAYSKSDKWALGKLAGTLTNVVAESNIVFNNNGTVDAVNFFTSGFTETDPSFVNPTTGDFNLMASSPAINVCTSSDQTTDFLFRPRNTNADNREVGALEYFPLQVKLKVFLEGSFNVSTGKMNDNLRSSQYLVFNEPYSKMGFTLANNAGQNTFNDVLNKTGDDVIVDWIFVELRNATNPLEVEHTRTALLQADGDVVDIDGVSPLTYPFSVATSLGKSYHIAIKHRNHLRLRTTSPVTIINNVNTFDFTANATFATPVKQIAVGKYAMYSGDLNQDGNINATDRSDAWNNRNLTGYNQNDCSMNGTVDATDRSNTWNNRNVSSGF